MTRLRLYIDGRTASSLRALGNVSNMIERELDGDCELEVIDVCEEPDAATDIWVTPALVRPETSSRKLIGDLSDHEEVMRKLELVEHA